MPGGALIGPATSAVVAANGVLVITCGNSRSAKASSLRTIYEKPGVRGALPYWGYRRLDWLNFLVEVTVFKHIDIVFKCSLTINCLNCQSCKKAKKVHAENAAGFDVESHVNA